MTERRSAWFKSRVRWSRCMDACASRVAPQLLANVTGSGYMASGAFAACVGKVLELTGALTVIPPTPA